MPVPINRLPRCKANSKRTGKRCQQPAMKNGCCRLHGGKSTGPRTAEGRKAVGKAHATHGWYSATQRDMRELLRWLQREVENKA